MKDKRKIIAVFFGGRSPEHDVSVYTGMEVMAAIDTTLFDVLPVYIAPHGQWYIGDALLDKKNYLFTEETAKALTKVQLDISAKGRGRLLPESKGLFSSAKPIPFDIALPTFHGLFGEDGGFQGLMEFANIPYAGMRAKPCSLFMDKDSTKKAFSGLDIPMLPHAAVIRPQDGLAIDTKELKALLKDISFPVCVKPANLGSSIGVGKAKDIDDVRAILMNLFQYDTKAIIEPFVKNLTEYNVALRVNNKGEIETSAIERPRSKEELLNFKEKYLSGGGKKTGGQKSAAGMIAMTRDINPDLPNGMDKKIREWATQIFAAYGAGGAPRIDFISDGKTNEVWFNELNPIPGSYGYFLWEAASGKSKILFTDFLTDLLGEAEALYKRKQIPYDPVPKDAQLLKRH